MSDDELRKISDAVKKAEKENQGFFKNKLD
jgi:hypothetical protein